MFRAELTKLKRSSTWIIAFVLPILAVTTGTINFAGNSNALDSGWASFTSQVVLFYGLLFYSMGISLLAATAWRMEHRGTNWNLLLTATAKPFRLAAAKVGAVFIPVTLMQAVLVTGTAFSGIFVLHLEGPFPWGFAVVGFIALITVQSLLSMLLKSFAAPVALCLLGCVAGVAAVTSTTLKPIGYILPQAINTRALNLGSIAIAESGGLTIGDAASLLITSLALTAALAWITVPLIQAVKLR